MLNKLAKNQYVKIIKSNLENSDIEYGVVLNDENEKYDIMSIGFENKNGKFVEYPTNVENLVQSYTTQDAQFDEVKENEVRRKMNIWLENNYKSNYRTFMKNKTPGVILLLLREFFFEAHYASAHFIIS